jgi:hypothetical protein
MRLSQSVLRHSRYVNHRQCKGARLEDGLVIRISNIMEYFPGFKSDAASADQNARETNILGAAPAGSVQRCRHSNSIARPS